MPKSEVVPEHVVARLIAAGKSMQPDQELVNLFTPKEQREYASIMRLSPESWQTVATSLGVEDIRALVKSLTFADEILVGWSSGSVTAGIWVFREFQSRFPDHANVLADWVLRHTNNSYLPFGSDNLGACSVEEFQELQESRRKRKRAHIIRQREQQRKARHRRAARATESLFNAARQGDRPAVIALLNKGADSTKRNLEGLTAADVAAQEGWPEIADLIRNTASPPPQPSDWFQDMDRDRS